MELQSCFLVASDQMLLKLMREKPDTLQASLHRANDRAGEIVRENHALRERLGRFQTRPAGIGRLRREISWLKRLALLQAGARAAAPTKREYRVAQRLAAALA